MTTNAIELEQVPRALTIAGSDSGGGAGIQADLKTFAAYGVYGSSAVTAVTAQNTLGVADWLAMPEALVAGQINAVLDDIGAGAVKTGMLANAGIVRTVAGVLRERGVSALVVDPVMVAKGGTKLLEDDAIDALVRELIPLAAVVTPNVPEAEMLTGSRIQSLKDAQVAARAIAGMGARSVVVKGGHLDDSERSTDIFFDGQNPREFHAIRVRTQHTHGTGCTFSAAIAAGLAKGLSMADAVALAKSYVTLALQHAYPVGHGHGPVHHFYRYWQPVGPKYRPGVIPR
ncbi:MAG: bifunctional hydroxymethylpyrimidine kinase/phosphomethylpyrimidine kinase [Chloroflexi bacterium]|nr:bifunctional hydroxymethylpyrimidine kinase/phosphomethylpyrimidine kinase [Chloroflexota bacterium]